LKSRKSEYQKYFTGIPVFRVRFELGLEESENF
jgi:hypothetical protein